MVVWWLLVSMAIALPEAREIEAEFRAEAASRSVDLPTTRARIRGVARLDNAGFCRQERRPVVLLRRSTWRELDDLSRRALLFHELGHCYLDRRHDNRTLPNGEWRSLMRGGNTGDQRVWIGLEADRRRYYLDQLFAPDTPIPSWSTPTPGPAAWTAPTAAPVLVPDIGVPTEHPALRWQTATVQGRHGLFVTGWGLHISRDPVDGVIVGVLGQARPWFHQPGLSGALWIHLTDDAVHMGAGDTTLVRVPRRDGPTTPSATVGRYRTSAGPDPGGTLQTLASP